MPPLGHRSRADRAAHTRRPRTATQGAWDVLSRTNEGARECAQRRVAVRQRNACPSAVLTRRGASLSAVVVTSEPKKSGTASLVATQMGLATLEENDAARERWTAIVERFLAGVAPGR